MSVYRQKELMNAWVKLLPYVSVIVFLAISAFLMKSGAYAQGLSQCGGTVWDDRNGNGVMDANEPLPNGVRITITYADDSLPPVTSLTTQGLWSADVVTGQQIIIEVAAPLPGGLQPGYVGGNNAGMVYYTTTDNCSDIQQSTISLSACSDKCLEVGNLLWKDANGNGIQNANELGIPGANFDILDSSGAVVYSGTTDADGSWLITGEIVDFACVHPLEPLTDYTILFGDQTQYDPGGMFFETFAAPTNSTRPSLDTEVVENANGFYEMSFTTPNPGVSDTTLDIGVTPPTTIGDFVWIDENRDGERNEITRGYTQLGTYNIDSYSTDHVFDYFGDFLTRNPETPELEPVAVGVTVELWGDDPANGDGVVGNADDVLIATTTTDQYGQYLFSPLVPNFAYEVRIITSTLPLGGIGFEETFSGDMTGDSRFVTPVLSPGQLYLDADFAYFATPELSVLKSTDATAQELVVDNTIKWTIEVSNTGTFTANDVVVQDMVGSHTSRFSIDMNTGGLGAIRNVMASSSDEMKLLYLDLFEYDTNGNIVATAFPSADDAEVYLETTIESLVIATSSKGTCDVVVDAHVDESYLMYRATPLSALSRFAHSFVAIECMLGDMSPNSIENVTVEYSTEYIPGYSTTVFDVPRPELVTFPIEDKYEKVVFKGGSGADRPLSLNDVSVASSNTEFFNLLSNSDTSSVQIFPDLAVSKSTDEVVTDGLSPITYKITIENTGDTPYMNAFSWFDSFEGIGTVTVSDPNTTCTTRASSFSSAPDTYSFVDCVYTPTSGVFDVGDVYETEITLTPNLRIIGITPSRSNDMTVRNSAGISSGFSRDSVSLNNSGFVDTPVSHLVDSFVKSSPSRDGDQIRWEINVSVDPSSIPAGQVLVIQEFFLPDSVEPNGWECGQYQSNTFDRFCTFDPSGVTSIPPLIVYYDAPEDQPAELTNVACAGRGVVLSDTEISVARSGVCDTVVTGYPGFSGDPIDTTIEKSHTIASTQPGDVFLWQVTVEERGIGDDFVYWVDQPGPGLTIQQIYLNGVGLVDANGDDVTGDGWNCSLNIPDDPSTAEQEDKSSYCESEFLFANQSVTFDVEFLHDDYSTGLYAHNDAWTWALNKAETETGNAFSDQNADDDIPVRVPDPAVIKSHDATNVMVGDFYTQTVDVFNNDVLDIPSDFTGDAPIIGDWSTPIVISDVLPITTEFVGLSTQTSNDWSCVDQMLPVTSTTGVVITPTTLVCTYTNSAGFLAPGESAPPLIYELQAVSSGSANNVVAILYDGGQALDFDADNISEDTVVVGVPTVFVQKGASADAVVAGDGFEYSLTVVGISAIPAPFVVTDTMPSGVVLENVDSPEWDCSFDSSDMECTYTGGTGSSVDSPAGTFTNITLTVKVSEDATAGISENAVYITYPNSEYNTRLFPATKSVLLSRQTSVSVSKSRSVEAPTVGNVVDYVIDINVSGPSSAEDVQIRDYLPTGLQYVGFVSSDINWSCALDNVTVICDRAGFLPVGDHQIIIQALVTPDARGLTNVIEISTITGLNPEVEQTLSAVDDVFIQLACFGDQIWSDIDGVTQPEPDVVGGDILLEGVGVSAMHSDGTVYTTTTNAIGEYLFDFLPTGDYTVMVDTNTLPAGKQVNPVHDPDGGADSSSSISFTDDFLFDFNQDFSFVEILGTLGNYVFHDADGDGVYNPANGDFPLEGVVVELNALTMPWGTITATTDVNGRYLFDELPLNESYTVEIDTSTLPTNKIPTATAGTGSDDDSMGSNVLTATLTVDGRDDLTRDFGFEPILGSIGDTIFHDADEDGTQATDGTEPGLEGVAVTLEQPDGSIIQTTTDSTGFYEFAELPLGTYTVTVDTSTLPDSKTDIATADPDGGADSTSTTTLTPDSPDDPTQDFGYAPATGSIGNTVFHDADEDGVFDPNANDFPLDGVVVMLEGSDGTVMTATTDADGLYLFDELPLNITYTVSVDLTTVPDDKVSEVTMGEDGDGETSAQNDDSDNSVGSDIYEVFLVVDDPATPEDEQHEGDADFGIAPLLGHIGDTIWHDANRDGVDDADTTEPPISGVTVTLLDANGDVVDTAETDANGMYLFDDLPLGEYTVVVDESTLPADKIMDATGDPEGDGDGESTTTLTTDAPDNLDRDFGYAPQRGSIGNTVFHDADEDGVYEPSEDDFVLSGVVVTLEGSDGTVMTATTDADGHYLFDDLALGETYIVTVDTSTLPDDKIELITQGSDEDGETTNSGDQSVGDVEYAITLEVDDPSTPEDEQDDRDGDFGISPLLGSIGDIVWHDANRDGEQDAGEQGLEGVVVTLIDLETGASITATTSVTGYYSFDELPLGDYQVTVDTDTLPDDKVVTPTADPDGGMDSTSFVTIDTDEPDNSDQDFAYGPKRGTIGNLVFHDADRDGLYEATEGDFPLEGVVIILEDVYGMVLTETTDADGEYLFTDLALDETYTVTIDLSTAPMDKAPVVTGDGVDVAGESNNYGHISVGVESVTVTLSLEDVLTPESEQDERDADYGLASGLGSVGDIVFHDADGDGVYEPEDGEVPLVGVVVELINSSGNAVTETTAADGTYLFDELPFDTYTVTVDATTLPDDKVVDPTFAPDLGEGEDDGDQSVGSNSVSVIVDLDDLTTDENEQHNTDVDFGYEPQTGSIGDKVWHDANADGAIDAVDFPLEGVIVSLTDESGNTITTSTDANGNYLFDELPLDATYTIAVDTTTIPGNKDMLPTYGAPLVGESDGNDEDRSVGSTSIQVTLTLEDETTLESEQNERDVDFAFSPVFGSIGDTIFHDENKDGNQDTGEVGLPNVRVILTRPDGSFIDTTTNADGMYMFDELPLGQTYTVTVDTSTLPDDKQTMATADPDGNGDSTTFVELTDLYPDDDLRDFGYPPAAEGLGSIGNQIWNDSNRDGDDRFDPNVDQPLSDVMVRLYDANGIVDETVTDADGFYLFDELPYGTYTVTVDVDTLPDGKLTEPSYDPDGGEDSTSSTTIGEDEPNDPNQDFSYVSELFGSIGDRVWSDTPDGEFDSPLANVRVALYQSGQLYAETFTDDDGFYLFDELPLNITYTVVVDTNTLPDDKQVNVSYDPEGDSDSSSSVMLTSEMPDDSDRDFSYFAPDAPILGSIGDTVWHDADENGEQNPDGSEPGIEGVVVRLYDENDSIAGETVTDNTGYYLFDELPLGEYTVRVDENTLPDDKVDVATGDPEDDENGESTYTLTADMPDNVERDFGYPPVFVPADPLGSIGDTIFHDENKDGNQDVGEAGLPDVRVILTRPDGSFIDTTTNADGMYTFDELPLGETYTVTVDTSTLPDDKQPMATADPDGGSDSTSSVELTEAYPDDTAQDFGYPPAAEGLGSIGNQVWSDTNRDGDGQYDPNVDQPLSGVVVRLYDDVGEIAGETVTDEEGFYLFDELPYGTYTVRVDVSTLPEDKQNNPSYDPDGGEDSASEVTIDEDMPNNPDQDFSYVLPVDAPLGSIGDTIWSEEGVDTPDTYDANVDTPLSDVVVRLYDATGILAETTTDADGTYLFEDLPLGITYTVAVDTSTLPDVKRDDPLYDPEGDGDSQSSVMLTVEMPDDRDRDFSYVEPVMEIILPIESGSIGDTIWSDEDADGLPFDPELDTPLAGVRVFLIDEQGRVIDSEITDENGEYLFEAVLFGTYTVEVDSSTLPEDKQGNVSYDPEGDDDGMSTTTISVDNRNDRERDFGYFVPALGSVGDTIWHDINGDGMQDDGENGLGGVVVYLFDGDGSILRRTETNDNGMYLFNDLPLGITYTVSVDTSTLPDSKLIDATGDPERDGNSESSIMLTGQSPDDRDRDFGYAPVADASGQIGDTILNSTTLFPIQGVRVLLTTADGVQYSDVTDVDGKYLFEGLLIGEAYIVEVDTNTLPDNKEPMPTSDPDGDGDNTSTVTLTADNPINLDQDFEYGSRVPEGEIGDTIFHDANANGVQDDEYEPGLPNVIVRLTDADGNVTTAVTDENGKYLFEGLTPGATYTVEVVQDSLPDSKFSEPTADPEGDGDNTSTVMLPEAALNGTVYLPSVDLDQDFGYGNTVPEGMIGDTIFHDTNANGVQDAGEPGLPNVIVRLTDTAGNVTTTVTDEIGKYLFEGLTPGATYTVEVVQDSLPDGKFASPSADPEGDGDNTSTVTLPEAVLNGTVYLPSVDLLQDFGYTFVGSIGDTVFNDSNGNGELDDDERLLAGIVVFLYDLQNTKLMTTVTDLDGEYEFSNLPLTVYKVGLDTSTLPDVKDRTLTNDEDINGIIRDLSDGNPNVVDADFPVNGKPTSVQFADILVSMSTPYISIALLVTLTVLAGVTSRLLKRE